MLNQKVYEFVKENGGNTTNISKALKIHFYKLMPILLDLEKQGLISCNKMPADPKDLNKRIYRYWYVKDADVDGEDKRNKISDAEDPDTA